MIKTLTGLFMVVDEESPGDADDEIDAFNEILGDSRMQIESLKCFGEKNMIFEDGGKIIMARVFAQIRYSRHKAPLRRPFDGWRLRFASLGDGRRAIQSLNEIEESDFCHVVQSNITVVNGSAFVTVLFYDGR